MAIEVDQKLERYLNYLLQEPENINLLLDISACYRDAKAYGHARDYLEQVKRLAPEIAIYPEGELYFLEGNYEKALACFKEVMAQEESVDCRFAIALMLFHLAHFDEALTYSQPLSEMNHKDSQILRARIFFHQKKMDEALAELDRALQDEPENPYLLSLKSLICFESGREREGLQCAEQALVINPHLYEARLVKLFFHRVVTDDNLAEVEDLLQYQAQDPRLWLMRGQFFVEKFNFIEAEASLNRALELFPQYYDALISLSFCLFLQSKEDQALIICQQAVDCYPQDPEGWGGLALAHGLKGDFEKAQHYLDKCFAITVHTFMGQVTEILMISRHNQEKAKELFDGLFGEKINEVNLVFSKLLFADETSKVLH